MEQMSLPSRFSLDKSSFFSWFTLNLEFRRYKNKQKIDMIFGFNDVPCTSYLKKIGLFRNDICLNRKTIEIRFQTKMKADTRWNEFYFHFIHFHSKCCWFVNFSYKNPSKFAQISGIIEKREIGERSWQQMISSDCKSLKTAD